MEQLSEARWFEVLGHLVARSHLLQNDELADVVDRAVSRLGMRATVYLIDYEQVMLRALPVTGRETPPPLAVDSSLPGRVFAAIRPLPAAGDSPHLWTPVVDGTDRLGVIDFVLPDDADPADTTLQQRCELVAGLVGHLVYSKTVHGDHLVGVRRTQPMTTGAELLWRALQPLTSSTDRLAVSAVLQPCYEVGGDGFDYAIDGSQASLVLADAMGRGLPAGLACTLALAAIRAARRAGAGLYDQARAVDSALAGQFSETRFVTAILAELDLDTGRLRYINAGQPSPLLLRDGRLVRTLGRGQRMPLGLDDPAVEIAEEFLQPGDRLLLHSDGVTEAKTPAGERFGVRRLVDLAEQHHAAGLPAPETLRRLAHAALAHQDGVPADDATLLLAAWSPADARSTVPGPPWPSAEGSER